jgi:starch-binding outer membrane protein, SusD/RagB family
MKRNRFIENKNMYENFRQGNSVLSMPTNYFRIRHLSVLLFGVLLLGIASCSDYLDTVPGDKYDDNAIWSSSTLVEGFVYNIYNGIPYPYQWYMSASLVDEAIPYQNDGIITKVVTSTLTPEDQGAFVSNWALCMENWYWKSAYSNIRACNLFLSKIDDTSFTDSSEKQQLIGEVHFLRAYFYYLLMTQYGGVPLIDKVMNVGDSYEVARNTFAETIDFIIADLDAAVADSKLSSQTDKNRATEGAVYALKSRVLLYAASDLHHSTSWQNGYAHPELVGYTTDNQQELYKEAKAAAEKVMNMGTYSLYNAYTDKAVNFQQLFLKMTSDEQIFITTYDKVNIHYYGTDWLAWVCGTPSYGGFALNQVTANLADAFENSDGTTFNITTQASDPFSNRDPRFEATVLHNGSSWYYNNNGTLTATTIDLSEYGADSYYTPYGVTGYYIKKFISITDGDNTYYYGARQPQPYIQIRYAEVLLNYAEACLGIGGSTEEANARSAMNLIRKRAGMPDVTDTGSALLARYRNERRVELAWEGHRLWDVRRWMIGAQGYVNARGMFYDYSTYSEFDYQTRAWNNSHYLIPIPRTEINKDSKLIQNPGY